MVRRGNQRILLAIGFLGATLSFVAGITLAEDTRPDFVREYQEVRQDAEQKLASIQAEAMKAMDPTADLANQRELMEGFGTQVQAVLLPATERVFQFIQPYAAEPAAAEAIAWVARQRTAADLSDAATELLLQHHLVHPETIDVVVGMSRNGELRAEALLREQLSAADLPAEYRWKVMLALARMIQSHSAVATRLSLATEEELAEYQRVLGHERVAEMIELNAADLEKEAIALFDELGREYPTEEIIPGITVVEFAASSIFEITNLRVGKLAPDIIGEDLAGEGLTLSEYHGKAVLLSFWASWCAPCMAEIPFERKLVETYNDRPFAIVGVNGDFDPSQAEAAVEGQAISWRSFAGGPAGPLGPIAKAWNVSGWPTTYLIDHAGVIRGKQMPRELLEKKIADVVQEAELAMRD